MRVTVSVCPTACSSPNRHLAYRAQFADSVPTPATFCVFMASNPEISHCKQLQPSGTVSPLVKSCILCCESTTSNGPQRAPDDVSHRQVLIPPMNQPQEGSKLLVVRQEVHSSLESVGLQIPTVGVVRLIDDMSLPTHHQVHLSNSYLSPALTWGISSYTGA